MGAGAGQQYPSAEHLLRWTRCPLGASDMAGGDVTPCLQRGTLKHRQASYPKASRETPEPIKPSALPSTPEAPDSGLICKGADELAGWRPQHHDVQACRCQLVCLPSRTATPQLCHLAECQPQTPASLPGKQGSHGSCHQGTLRFKDVPWVSSGCRPRRGSRRYHSE